MPYFLCHNRPQQSHQAQSVVLVVLFFAAMLATPARAATLEELKKSIEQKQQEIKRIEEEAKKYKEGISEQQQRGRTLKAEIAAIEKNIRSLTQSIAVTEVKQRLTKEEIAVLAIQISQKEQSIETFRAGLSSIIQSLSQRESEPPVIMLAKYNTLSEFFKEFDNASTLHKRMLASLDTLRELRLELKAEKTQAEGKKQQLENLETELESRQQIQKGVKAERGILLSETKSQEKKYQELLREQERKREALEQEVLAIEEKIKIEIDRTRLPTRGIHVFGLPLRDLSLVSCFKGTVSTAGCITQFFGNTDFARSGGYNGKGHNGMDFRADIGTPALAVETGIVGGAGDTDIGCRGASYGKWILVKHPNNLSTLYAHLSQVSVTAGQSIRRGDVIGYTGKTGYATGPHLHFTVFATQAVRIDSLVSKVCGRVMILPIAALNGYLNPLDYL
ncbi:MAG: peptidoglycan DD-metalloendopeptidase family protein [Candidatus Sungbacteria bacterium]|nr:peptidoglycan DD-metalloendopeptidase family protein [Candidatus Sungbacteria bacterium]